jgi:hypothetical protein
VAILNLKGVRQYKQVSPHSSTFPCHVMKLSFLAGKLPCSSWNIHIRSGHRMPSNVLNDIWTWPPYHRFMHKSSRPNCIAWNWPDYTPRNTNMCTIICATITGSTPHPQIVNRSPTWQSWQHIKIVCPWELSGDRMDSRVARFASSTSRKLGSQCGFCGWIYCLVNS